MNDCNRIHCTYYSLLRDLALASTIKNALDKIVSLTTNRVSKANEMNIGIFDKLVARQGNVVE